jgi:hypothetical protein
MRDSGGIRGVSLPPPNGGRREHMGTPPKKETVVPSPIAVVRNWAIEQVTAIVSVTRPIHFQQSTQR